MPVGTVKFFDATKGFGFITREQGISEDQAQRVEGYWIEELDSPTYLKGHAASVWLSLEGKRGVIGEFGILHRL